MDAFWILTALAAWVALCLSGGIFYIAFMMATGRRLL